jgi:UTP-glucose-1-phosphate uridylyltransferase
MRLRQQVVKRIHIISSPSKDLSPLLRDIQDLHLNRPELDKSLFSSFSDVEVKVHLQQQQLGLGDAISCALDDISGPFLVLLGDNVLLDNHASTKNFIPSNASKLLVQCFEENNLPVVRFYRLMMMKFLIMELSNLKEIMLEM